VCFDTGGLSLSFKGPVGYRLESYLRAFLLRMSPRSGGPDILVRELDSRPRDLPRKRFAPMPQIHWDDDSIFFDLPNSAGKVVIKSEDGIPEIDCWELSNPAAFWQELMLPLISRLLLARKSRVLVHSAGVVLDGEGYLISGLPGSGKTRLLLAFLAQGATYLSDDSVIIDGSDRIFGLPREITLINGFMNHRDMSAYRKITGTYLNSQPNTYKVYLDELMGQVEASTRNWGLNDLANRLMGFRKRLSLSHRIVPGEVAPTAKRALESRMNNVVFADNSLRESSFFLGFDRIEQKEAAERLFAVLTASESSLLTSLEEVLSVMHNDLCECIGPRCKRKGFSIIKKALRNSRCFRISGCPDSALRNLTDWIPR